MARIHAREAALKVATEGLRWAIGAGQTDPNLAGSLNLPAIYQAQAGLIDDMDFVAEEAGRGVSGRVTDKVSQVAGRRGQKMTCPDSLPTRHRVISTAKRSETI